MINLSLAEQLIEIDKVVYWNKEDKKKKSERLIEDYWNEKNSLLEKVINKETSFSKEFKKVDKKIGGVRMLTPNYLDDKLQSEIIELRKYIGIKNKNVETLDYSDKTINLVSNPFGGAGLGYLTTVGVLTGVSLGQDKEIDRREFLDILKTGGIIAAFGAFSTGIISSYLKINTMQSAKKNALYLDNKIKELYSNSFST